MLGAMSDSPPSTKDIHRADRHFLHPWEDVTAIGETPRTVLMDSEGIYVTTSEGKRLIDGPGGMWCVNVGHGREEIIEACAAQMRRLSYFSPWSMASDVAAALAKRLAALSPGDLNNVFFTTGGSTAVDSALRFAFFYNNCLGRPEKKHVISRVNAYHGSTYLTASCSGKMREKEAMDMIEDHIHFLSCPKPKDRPEGQSLEDFTAEKVAELEAMILRVGADKVAAFIAEPVMASGGVIVQPDGYLAGCAEVCRRHDVLFIADEVVTSFGRLGHYFASEEVFGVQPDMLTTAKGLTSGYQPLGALFISDRLIEEISKTSNEGRGFTSGFTYSGHPVSCAAAMANLDIFERDGLLDHVQRIAPYFETALRSLSDIPAITDIRVKGLMAGLECELDPTHPDEDRNTAFAARVDEICQRHGLLLRPVYNACVMSPPLTISERQIDEMVAILRRGFEEALAER